VPLEGFPELTVAVLWRKDSDLPEAVLVVLPHIRAHSDWRTAAMEPAPTTNDWLESFLPRR